MKLIVNNDVFEKMSYWVKKAPGEISGLGIIKVEKGGILRVTKTVLLPQKNSGASTDIEAEDVCRAMFQFKDDTDGCLRWWWHSHVNMGVFWSGTDTATIKSFGGTSPESWVVSTVINKKNEWKNSIYIHSGKRMPWGTTEPLFIDDLEAEVEAIDEPRQAAWDEEYTKNVKPDVPVYQNYGNMYGRGYEGAFPTKTTTAGVITADSGLTKEMIEAAERAEYASGRPTGMTKAQWKRIKRKQISTLPQQQVLAFQKKEDTSKNDAFPDEYGLTKANWITLLEEGFDQEAVDLMVCWDFKADQIMEVVGLGADIDDVMDMIYDKKTPAQIIFAYEQLEMNDDTPVADRRYGNGFSQ